MQSAEQAGDAANVVEKTKLQIGKHNSWMFQWNSRKEWDNA
jgi:hypothetical protein